METTMLITREELALRRISLDKTYPAERFDFPGGEFWPVGAVSVKGSAELVGADIRIHGHVTTRVGAECDRCTASAEIPVEQDFDLLYRPVSAIAREEEIEIPPDELDVGFYPGDGINLADVVKEQVTLSLPMKVVCRADCRGLCPVCGANLNRGTCHCQPPKSESPFASLLKSE
ncbi:MAG: YceD family protein [Terriglobia bacterium]